MNHNTDISEEMLKEVKKVITSEIDSMIDEELNKIAERIKHRKSQIIVGVLMNMQKFIEFERFGTTIRVSIKNDIK